ncbi:hypothetical protein [Huaxiibacter chinensis]
MPHDLGRILKNLISRALFWLKRSHEDPGRSLRFQREAV